MSVRVLVMPGSRRQGSLNARLAAYVGARIRALGGEPTVLDPDGFPLPVYDGDIEAKPGLPAAARDLKRLVRMHDALVFVSPEYNASVTPLLKNVIDWVSRPGEPGEENVFVDKPVALFSASPGKLGGLRGLRHLREILLHCRAHVLAHEFALGNATRLVKPGESLAHGEKSAIDDVLRRLLVFTKRSTRLAVDRRAG